MPVEKLEFDMVKKKIEKVQNRRYITSGTVLSLTTFFRVPEESSDTHLVYDLTDYSMNESLWAPKLFMSSEENVLDTSTQSSWFGDVDSA